MREARHLIGFVTIALLLASLPACAPQAATPAAADVRSTGHDHDDHKHDSPVLELGSQARESLGLRIAPLERTDYARTLRVPGQVVAIPGVTEIDVTAKASGEVIKIFALQGQVVKPGEPLFELRLTHEDAITSQTELLDALAKLEVVSAEIKRLEKLERTSPGIVEGTRLVKQQYERGHLRHTIASRRQMLVLLGLPTDEVDAFIDRHRKQHHDMSDENDAHADDPPLLERLTIFAPQRSTSDSEQGFPFVVEHMHTRTGQHVELSTALCRLGDYRELHIEATAFEQDLGIIRRATAGNWPVTARIELRDAEALSEEQLPILYIAPAVDVASRSARFYVALKNEFRAAGREGARPFADWKYRPGQRIEVRVPVEQFRQELVVPADAIVREGLDHYLFSVDDGHVYRRQVSVLHRDEEVAVLGPRVKWLEGASVVMSGAYQLKLAFLNQSSGPATHAHGGLPHAH
jgi:multidrug efflux pump subunit AcrA (membrane-fusion protein)